jgi:hypothetical protein
VVEYLLTKCEALSLKPQCYHKKKEPKGIRERKKEGERKKKREGKKERRKEGGKERGRNRRKLGND